MSLRVCDSNTALPCSILYYFDSIRFAILSQVASSIASSSPFAGRDQSRHLSIVFASASNGAESNRIFPRTVRSHHLRIHYSIRFDSIRFIRVPFP